MAATRRVLLAALLVGGAQGFFLGPSLPSSSPSTGLLHPPPAATTAAAAGPLTVVRASTEAAESSRQAAVRERLSQEWELDCYSRPVVGEDGKKLWELLICDSLGEFKAVETMPSNMVNSRELRKLVEKVRPCLVQLASTEEGGWAESAACRHVCCCCR
jgi:hypothetical protein